jgi:glycerophosphoryl diester phosphodiesterase
MEAAILNGYPGFEIDVNLTRDGQLVVAHDQKLDISTRCEGPDCAPDSCKGMIADRTLDELRNCWVIYTGLVPEKKIFHSKAVQPAPMPSLEETLDRFLPDPRVKRIVLDVKPGDGGAISSATDRLLAGRPAIEIAKIIFLVRTPELRERLQKYEDSLIALESSSGWEPLERYEDLGAAGLDRYTDEEALSVSLGLGLTLSGARSKSIPNRVATYLRVVRSIPELLWTVVKGKFDLSAARWDPYNVSTFEEMLHEAKRRELKIVGWTVSTPPLIRSLRRRAPEIDQLLSDLPFRTLA